MTKKRKASKPKGNAYENVIAKAIRSHFIPEAVSSTVAYNLVHRTPQSGGSTERGDIIVQPPLLEYFPYFFECRNRESWSWSQIFKNPFESVIGKWYLQDAVGKCHPYNGVYERKPLLVFTKNYELSYVMFDYEIFYDRFLKNKSFTWRTIFSLNQGSSDESVVIITSFNEFLNNHEVPDESIYATLRFDPS